jgi:hypothetical protein
MLCFFQIFEYNLFLIIINHQYAQRRLSVRSRCRLARLEKYGSCDLYAIRIYPKAAPKMGRPSSSI